jgi:hypothetical protein
MTWLVQEIWLWMVLAAVAGAVLTGFFSTTEVKTERWVPTPVPEESEPEEAPAAAPVASGPAEEQDEVITSPFPEFQATSGPRPWEEEELWTRPVRGASAAAPPADAATDPETHTETHTETEVGEIDEWAEAANSWRGWAAETTAVETAAAEPDVEGAPEASGPHPRRGSSSR